MTQVNALDRGAFAYKKLEDVPDWYLRHLVADQTPDSIKWEELTEEEKTAVQEELKRREEAVGTVTREGPPVPVTESELGPGPESEPVPVSEPVPEEEIVVEEEPTDEDEDDEDEDDDDDEEESTPTRSRSPRRRSR